MASRVSIILEKKDKSWIPKSIGYMDGCGL
jgi:hypothetical protein